MNAFGKASASRRTLCSPPFRTTLSLINSYRTWNAAGCLVSTSSFSFRPFCLFPFALLSNKAIMNLIINTLIKSFITYTPFSSHLKFFSFYRNLPAPIKKPGRFVDRAFLFDACLLQFRINTTWSYWYMIILFSAAINTH